MEMHDDLMRTLGFPDYYGKNSAALRNCLADLRFPEQATGVAVVLRRFDVWAGASDSAGNSNHGAAK